MNKSIFFLVCFGLVVFIGFSSVEGMTISPWVGYTTLGMSEPNAFLEDIKESYETYMGISMGLTKFGSCYLAGVDIGMLRLEYIPTVTAAGSWEEIGFRNNVGLKSSLSAALIGFRLPRPKKSSLNFGVYAGYALASATLFATANIGTPIESGFELPYEGSGIIAEAIIGLNIGIFELNVGYRYCIIEKVELPKAVGIDIDNDGFIDYTYPEGEVFEDSDGPIPFDYSGIVVSLGLRFGGGKTEPERTTFPGYYGQNFTNQKMTMPNQTMLYEQYSR